MAVVANYGVVSGDADSVSLISLRGPHARIVDTVSVGPSPEGVACASDGSLAAAAVQNMSTLPSSDASFSPASRLVLLAIEGERFKRLDAAEIGPWAQGVAFAAKNRLLIAETTGDRSLHIFEVAGGTLRPLTPVTFPVGGPVAIGTTRQ